MASWLIFQPGRMVITGGRRKQATVPYRFGILDAKFKRASREGQEFTWPTVVKSLPRKIR